MTGFLENRAPENKEENIFSCFCFQKFRLQHYIRLIFSIGYLSCSFFEKYRLRRYSHSVLFYRNRRNNLNLKNVPVYRLISILDNLLSRTTTFKTKCSLYDSKLRKIALTTLAVYIGIPKFQFNKNFNKTIF